MIISFIFFTLSSYVFSFLGCMLLWLDMSFFIDGMVHSLILANILYSIFHIPPFFCILSIMIFYIITLKILGAINNTNMIIASQILIIIALMIKPNINFYKILFGSIIEPSLPNLLILMSIIIYILFKTHAFIKYVIFNNIKINETNKHVYITYQNQIICLCSIFLSIILPLGHANLISLFIFPPIIAYEMSNNIYQMLLYSTLVILILFIYNLFILNQSEYFLSIPLLLIYIFIKLIKVIHKKFLTYSR